MSRRRAARVPVFAFLVFGAGVVPRAARADAAAARALFDDARKLAASGSYPAACPKFEESYKLDPGMGTLFNLADCWEHLGKTASAWVRFREVADAASRAGQADREKIARNRAAALEPKLSRLVVQVKAANGVDVTKDGAPFGSAQWDTPIPVDPGAHTLEAKAPLKMPWSRTVDVPANGTTITIVVPALDPAPPSAEAKTSTAGAAAVTAGGSAPAADTGAPGSGSSWNGQKTAAVVLGAVAVAGGVFTVLKIVDYNEKVTDANNTCPNACHEPFNSEAKAILDDARSARTQAIVAGVIGGASLIGGAALWFTASSSTSSSARLRWEPLVGAHVQGIGLSGVW